MNLFRSEEHARRWAQFNPASEEAGLGFIALPDLVAFFGTETRRHMLDPDYLSAWYPKRAAERRARARADRQDHALLARYARAVVSGCWTKRGLWVMRRGREH